ncbi:hypothetical protein [Paraburkholderia sp. JHI869]|uniref:hypothetical protein n=1 Tax=Paraburkholderia sp. JHI869 TaxID=3112959 RepID=UPI0031722DB0
MEIDKAVEVAHEAWVVAREKVARELPPLILDHSNDDLIRALIALETAAHRLYVDALDRANEVTQAAVQ